MSRTLPCRAAPLVVSAALLGALARPAIAGKWPTPAAGSSQSGAPEVIFTFDDGPHERHTSALLDILGEHEVQAIFFWTGHRVLSARRRVVARRKVVSRAVSEGHLVANHTVNHAHLCAIPARDAAREIDLNAATYAELAGLPMLLFRAPYGDSCARLRVQLAERDLDHLHWDVDPQEFRSHDSDHAADYVIRKLRNLDDDERAVVLMHDTHLTTVRAIPKILEWIERENRRRRRRGHRAPIRIVPASELVEESFEIPTIRWVGQLGTRVHERLHEGVSSLIPPPPTGRRAER